METEREKGDGDREGKHMLTQGAQTERWRNEDVGGRQRKVETGSWGERGIEAVVRWWSKAKELHHPKPSPIWPPTRPYVGKNLCSQPQHKASTQQIQAGTKALTVVSVRNRLFVGFIIY